VNFLSSVLITKGVVFRFIHLADYMILHLLYVLSRNSLEDLVLALRTHFRFLPSNTRLCTVETYKKLEDTRPAGAPQVRRAVEYRIILGYYLQQSKVHLPNFILRMEFYSE
jgi:hypothetical protein